MIFAQFLAQNGLDALTVMNALQSETHLIADECVDASDVAGKDAWKAIEWVKRNFLRKKAKI